MFDFGIGSGELLMIAIVALIVIGPKDLPRLLRTMGQYMRKIQGLAREFQNHLNEAAKESGVEDVKKEVKGMTNFTVTADLDRHGSEIKRAIEAGAPKSPPARHSNGADGTKAGGAKGKTEPAKTELTKIEPAKPSPAVTKPIAATEPVAVSAKPAKPEVKPSPALKSNPALKSKARAGRKADVPPQAVKS